MPNRLSTYPITHCLKVVHASHRTCAQARQEVGSGVLSLQGPGSRPTTKKSGLLASRRSYTAPQVPVAPSPVPKEVARTIFCLFPNRATESRTLRTSIDKSVGKRLEQDQAAVRQGKRLKLRRVLKPNCDPLTPANIPFATLNKLRWHSKSHCERTHQTRHIAHALGLAIHSPAPYPLLFRPHNIINNRPVHNSPYTQTNPRHYHGLAPQSFRRLASPSFVLFAPRLRTQLRRLLIQLICTTSCLNIAL
jgi:hypothetical protein